MSSFLLGGFMKYFIYYSNSGNGDLIASKLKEKGYEIIKVEPVKPLKKMGFFGILKYGGDAMFNKCMKIKPLNLNIKENDEVVIGSPIWNDRLSTPINSVLKQYKFVEQTKFILYPAGKTTNKSLKQIAKQGYKGECIVISYPKKNLDLLDKAIQNL